MSETDQVPDAPKVKVWLPCIADTLEVRIMESEDELDDYLRDDGTIGATEALKVVADSTNGLDREKAEELLPATDASRSSSTAHIDDTPIWGNLNPNGCDRRR